MRFFARVLCFILPMIAGTVTGSIVDGETDPREIASPVVISGAQLGSLRGKEIRLMRVLSLRDGHVSPIPFQIDQKNSAGEWVWDVAYRQRPVSDYRDDNLGTIGSSRWRLEPHTGLTDDDDGGAHLVDDNDLLVFMVKDMGSRIPDVGRRLDQASIALEIEVSLPSGGGKAWAYVAYYASDPPPPSSLNYVRYQPRSGRIISPVYEIRFSPEHIAVLQDLEISGIPLMDRTRLRGSLLLGTDAFGTTVHFDATDIQGQVDGYIDGPVRVVKRNSGRLRFGLPFLSASIRSDQFFYRQHSQIPVNLPSNFLIGHVSLLLSADFYGSPFQRVHAGDMSIPVNLPGLSPGTNALEGASQAPWLALDGRSVSIVSVLTLPEAIEPFATVTPYLAHDTVPDHAENLRARGAEAGYLVTTEAGFPSGRHTLVATYLYLPRPFASADGDQVLDLAEPGPDYRIVSRHVREKNSARAQRRLALRRPSP